MTKIRVRVGRDLSEVFAFPRRTFDEGRAEFEAVKRCAKRLTPRGDAHIHLDELSSELEVA